MAGIALNPSGCCCTPAAPTCDACPACAAINMCVDLTFSYTNVLAGGGMFGIFNLGGCTWDSLCQAPIRVIVDMTGPTTLLHVYQYSPFSNCPDGTPSVACVGLAPSSSSCNPFLAQWTITSSNCPGLYSLGYRNFTASR